MKIAVHLPHVLAAAGGGFTFQESLREAILANTCNSQHEFVVFTESAPGSTRSASVIHIPSSQFDRVVRRAQFLFHQAQDTLLQQRYVHVRTQFEQLLEREKIDLVWFATPAHIECSKPYLYTIWDLQHRYQPWFPEVGTPGVWNSRELLTRRAVSRAACVIVPGRQGEAELMHCYAVERERILKLPHPTPPFALSNTEKPPAELPGELNISSPFLLYPAQFWAHKNHVTLLQAFKLLCDRGSDLSLVLVGSDKGNKAHIENTARALGIFDRLRILGFVELQTLIALYQRAACLAYVSLFGPENLPPLEAFGLGCPVVSANYLGAEEQLGDAALLVDPLNATALADALGRVLADSELRHDLVKRGRARASAYTATDYLRGVTGFLDGFAAIRANWP
jgi:glycosyltransferase involved in cell wall biosynthesis